MKSTARSSSSPALSAEPWAKGFFDAWRPYAWTALGCLVFLPTLDFGLTLLDDNIFLKERLGFLSDFSHLKEVWTSGAFLDSSSAFYRPLGMTLLMLDARWASFRITNILLHLACSWLVGALLRKMGYSKGRAGFLSLLFAVHPLMVQAVAWVPGRTDTFLAVLVLPSFIFFIDFLSSRKWGFLAAHLTFFALAMLAKELAVILPAACVLYAFLAARGERLPARGWAAALAGWALAGGGWHLLRGSVLKAGGGYSLGGMIKSVWVNLPAALIYLGKMLFPVNLSTYPILKDSPLFYGALCVILAGAALALSKGADWRRSAWGLGWLLLFLLPSFVYPDVSILPVFFEYRAYLPMVGFMVLIAETDCLKALDAPTARVLARALGFAALLAGLTWLYSRSYKDAYFHWQSAVRNSPNSAFAHRQMGVVHYFQGEIEEARREYLKSLELNPREPMVHNNLGVIHMRAQRWVEAEAEFLKELENNPGYDLALDNLGVIAYNKRDFPRAEALWVGALRTNPNNADAYLHLAVLYLNAGHRDRAKAMVAAMKSRGYAPPPELEAIR